MPRTRYTASALWSCAGQAITDKDPGRNAIACAIAQAAVIVLPTWRAVKARIEAPRGARRNVS
jgi:threonine/homoserine efflux transporter RhtA